MYAVPHGNLGPREWATHQSGEEYHRHCRCSCALNISTHASLKLGSLHRTEHRAARSTSRLAMDEWTIRPQPRKAQ